MNIAENRACGYVLQVAYVFLWDLGQLTFSESMSIIVDIFMFNGTVYIVLCVKVHLKFEF